MPTREKCRSGQDQDRSDLSKFPESRKDIGEQGNICL